MINVILGIIAYVVVGMVYLWGLETVRKWQLDTGTHMPVLLMWPFLLLFDLCNLLGFWVYLIYKYTVKKPLDGLWGRISNVKNR